MKNLRSVILLTGVVLVILSFAITMIANFVTNSTKITKAIVVEYTNPLNSVKTIDTFYVKADIDGMSLGDQFPMWIILNTCPDNTSLIGDADMEVKNLVDMLEHECSTPHDIQQEIGFKYGEIVAAWIEE